MHLALSTVSSQLLWILVDEKFELVDSRQAINDDQSQMSTQLGLLLDDLLMSHRVALSKIKSLGVVTGPGAFTGLRMGVSFSEGLCLVQNIKKIAIPTFELVGKSFVMPLRHTKAPELSTEDYVNEGFESLLIRGPYEYETVSQIPSGVEHRGFLGSYPWPSNQDLLKAFRASLDRQVERFEINYGLAPKIFGVRTHI